MLSIDIITLFPDFLEAFLNYSIPKRAVEKKKIEVNIIDLREFSTNKHRKVDDYSYGGEAGMVLMPEPLSLAIETLTAQHQYDEVIFLTPDGKLMKQVAVNAFSLKTRFLLICGHYKGIDERIRKKYVTQEISIGDYVLSGGEIPAMTFVDSICRIIPGVLGDETSALSDSFQDNLLSHPVYTRPKVFQGMKVPEILFSGNHKKINDWRIQEAIKRTKSRRPDLLQ